MEAGGMVESIESLMAEGHSRVQAIKMLYETSSRTPPKPTTEEDPTSSRRPSLARQDSKVLQEAQRINTSNFRKPSLLRVESLDTDLHEDHDHDELDGMSTPSSLSEDTCFRDANGHRAQAPPAGHHLPMEYANQNHPPQQQIPLQLQPQLMKQMPAGIKPLSADARMLDLQPMRKLHSDIFPNVMSPPHPDPRYQQHNANGYYSESEEGSEQPDAMQQGQQFLQHSGYSEDERSEFYFLLEQGFSVEEAKDFIQQRRDNIAQKTANMAASPRLEHKSSKDEANVRELSPAISYSSSQEYHRDSHYQRGVRPSDVGPAPSAASQPPRAIKPLRVDDLCGDFDQDINLLLNNGYDIEQAREICDQVYASRGYSRHPPIPAPAPAPAPAPMHVQTPPQHAPVQFAQRERGMSRSDSPSMGQGAPPKRLVQRIASVPSEEMSSASFAPASFAPAPYLSAGAPVFAAPGPPPASLHSSTSGNTTSTLGRALTTPPPAAPSVVDSPSRAVMMRKLSGGLTVNTAAPKPAEAATLQLGLIISQQEAVYGTNMYDALLPSDESTIEEFVRQGFTLDDAVLLIFEKRYGRVQIEDNSSRKSTPTMASNRRSSEPGIGTSKQIDYEAANQLEAEIALLMATGYGRDEAVQILLKRRTAARQDEDMASVSEASSSQRLSFSGAGRSASISRPSMSTDLRRASFNNQAASYTPTPPISIPAPSSSYSNNNYNAPYHAPYEEPYESSQYYGSPSNMSFPSSYGAGGGGGGGGGAGLFSYLDDPNYAYGSQYGQSAQQYAPPDNSHLPLSKLSSDERALRVGLMISEQDATYGTNMFESISHLDGPYLDQLRSEGYEEDEAAHVLFENKVANQVILPRPQPPPRRAPAPKEACPQMAEAMRLSEREHAGRPGVERVTGPGLSPVGSGGGGGLSGPTSPMSPNGHYPLDLGDTRDLDPASMGTLMGMGFTEGQAAQSLRMYNYDLFDATNYLLGNQ